MAKKKKGKSKPKPKPPRGKPAPEWKGPAYAWATLIFGALFGLTGGCETFFQNDGKAGVFFTQGIELRHTAAKTTGDKPEDVAKAGVVIPSLLESVVGETESPKPK